MPKVGMESVRRQALIEAVVATAHQRGSLDVTVGQIAKKAGVSSGLAHHYFGTKDQLLLATMRHLLTTFSQNISSALQKAGTPRQRLSVIVATSFSAEQFRPDIISTWLMFYVNAFVSPQARQLHHIYSRRLHSNLCHALKPLNFDAREEIAETIASLIDGIYIRYALNRVPLNPQHAINLIENYINLKLSEA